MSKRPPPSDPSDGLQMHAPGSESGDPEGTLGPTTLPESSSPERRDASLAGLTDLTIRTRPLSVGSTGSAADGRRILTPGSRTKPLDISADSSPTEAPPSKQFIALTLTIWDLTERVKAESASSLAAGVAKFAPEKGPSTRSKYTTHAMSSDLSGLSVAVRGTVAGSLLGGVLPNDLSSVKRSDLETMLSLASNTDESVLDMAPALHASGGWEESKVIHIPSIGEGGRPVPWPVIHSEEIGEGREVVEYAELEKTLSPKEWAELFTVTQAYDPTGWLRNGTRMVGGVRAAPFLCMAAEQAVMGTKVVQSVRKMTNDSGRLCEVKMVRAGRSDPWVRKVHRAIICNVAEHVATRSYHQNNPTKVVLEATGGPQ